MIKDITLTNFKCFDHTSIEIAPLTLLTGLNSTGKSSVIQSILLLKQSYLDRSLADKRFLLNGNLIQLGTVYDVLYEEANLGDEIGVSLLWTDKILEWRFSTPETNAQTQNYIEAKLTPDLKEIQDIFLLNDQFNYLSAERFAPKTSFPTSPVVDIRRQLGTQGEFTAYYLWQFGRENIQIDALHHITARSNSLIHETEAWLGEIAPGSRIQVNILANMDSVELRYAFENQFGESRSYRPTNVGFGITYILPVIVAILSASPGAIVLVENPESHIHPRGQAALGRLFAKAASNGVQVIAESHSDHIMNGIRVAVAEGDILPNMVAINYFVRENTEEGTSHYSNSLILDQYGRFIEEWPEGFFDTWEEQLAKLLRK